MQRLVLASQSPRRRQLLANLGLKFDIIPPLVEETLEPWDSPIEYAERLSLYKARNVATVARDAVVIAADTIVVSEDQILGKPGTPEEALAMLRLLSGRKHQVITGVAVIDVPTGRELVESEVTRVEFRDLSDEQIRCYVATGEPMDKAGAYGIQGYGALLVSRIEGCYYNVVGLPLARLDAMLSRLGINLWERCKNCNEVPHHN